MKVIKFILAFIISIIIYFIIIAYLINMNIHNFITYVIVSFGYLMCSSVLIIEFVKKTLDK